MNYDNMPHNNKNFLRYYRKIYGICTKHIIFPYLKDISKNN